MINLKLKYNCHNNLSFKIDSTPYQAYDYRVYVLFLYMFSHIGLYSQSGFYRVHHSDRNHNGQQLLSYTERLYLLSKTRCDNFDQCTSLSEINEEGEILWTEVIPEIDATFNSSFIYNDTIFITSSNYLGRSQYRLVAYSLDGKRLEYREIEHPELKFTTHMLLSATVFNGLIVLAGHGQRNNRTNTTIYVLDTEFNLDTLIIANMTGFDSTPWSLFVTHDSLLTIMIAVDDQGSTPRDYRVIQQYNKDLEVVWRHETEDMGADFTVPVGCELPDGRLVMVIRSAASDNIAGLRCLNRDGSISWNWHLNSHGSRRRRIVRVKPLPNGDVIGTGQYSELQFGAIRLRDAPFLFKVSSSGELLWERTYYEIDPRINTTDGRPQNRRGMFWDFTFLEGGDILLSGYVNHESWDILLVRTDSNGCIYPDNCGTENFIDYISSTEEPEVEIPHVRIFPNPSPQGILYVDMSFYHYLHTYRFSLYDMSGRLVFSEPMVGASHSFAPAVASGMYVATIEMGGRVVHREKVVF
jgi:hypothetical protein